MKQISGNILNNGVELLIGDGRFTLEFPDEVWNDYPEDLKRIFIDNYTFLKSLHLPQLLNNSSRLVFSTSYPLFKSQLYNCLLNSIPFCADVDGRSTVEELKRYLNLEFEFSDHDVKYPSYTKKLNEKAVLSMSFGKDSLLSYGLANELGLDVSPVISFDNDCLRENQYKMNILRRFSHEFGKKVWSIKNDTSIIHRHEYWDAPDTEWGVGHLITEYCLNMLPYAHHLNASYVLLGNEKSCDDFYINKEGYKSYPVYDQSSEWMLELSKMTKFLTNNQMQVVSLIEPLYELAILKILHNRYPEIGKYQMSCFPDENEYGKSHYWCEHCSKCARVFILMKANNLDPARVGFKTDMLRSEFRKIYSIFGVGKEKDYAVGYDVSGCGRDEQLYAFYLAYKNGVKGDLIELFGKNHLEEAKQREDELHRKFFGIHNSRTIPHRFLKPLHSIYREELSK